MSILESFQQTCLACVFYDSRKQDASFMLKPSQLGEVSLHHPPQIYVKLDDVNLRTSHSPSTSSSQRCIPGSNTAIRSHLGLTARGGRGGAGVGVHVCGCWVLQVSCFVELWISICRSQSHQRTKKPGLATAAGAVVENRFARPSLP